MRWWRLLTVRIDVVHTSLEYLLSSSALIPLLFGQIVVHKQLKAPFQRRWWYWHWAKYWQMQLLWCFLGYLFNVYSRIRSRPFRQIWVAPFGMLYCTRRCYFYCHVSVELGQLYNPEYILLQSMNRANISCCCKVVQTLNQKIFLLCELPFVIWKEGGGKKKKATKCKPCCVCVCVCLKALYQT